MKTRFTITLLLLTAILPMVCTAQQSSRPRPNGNTPGGTFQEFVERVLLSPGNNMDFTKSLFEVRHAEGVRAFGAQAVVCNYTSTRSVCIKTNHPDGIFEEGDRLVVEVVSDVDGYIVIINQHPDGTFTVLYPNEYAPQQKIKAGETVFYPPQGAGWEIVTKYPFGEERLIAVVSKQPLNVKDLDSPEFYARRGLLQGGDKFGVQEVPAIEPAQRVEIAVDDFPCQTITVYSYPKGKRPASLPKQRFVLLIGPTIYQWENYRPLPACHNDVILLARIFEKYGQIDAMGVLSGKDVTKENVRKAFDALIEKSRPGDEIFIVWTGHGGLRADTSGTQPTGKTGYLVLYDSLPNDPNSVLTDVEFERWLDDLDGRRIAIFLDACCAESMIDASLKSEDAEDMNFFANKFAKHLALDGVKDIRSDQAVVLCSSRKNEKSVVRKDIPVSAMIWCMAECLFENDKVCCDDIYRYVEKRVPVVVGAQYQRVQQPVYMNQIGEILVKP